MRAVAKPAIFARMPSLLEIVIANLRCAHHIRCEKELDPSSQPRPLQVCRSLNISALLMHLPRCAECRAALRQSGTRARRMAKSNLPSCLGLIGFVGETRIL